MLRKRKGMEYEFIKKKIYARVRSAREWDETNVYTFSKALKNIFPQPQVN